MSLIAEYELSNPILRETRRAEPDVVLQVEDEHLSAGEPAALVIWARGEDADLEAFHERLPADGTVEAFELLANLGERRLYRVSLTETGLAGVTYSAAFELGITFLDIRAQGDGVRYRAQVPSREALFAYRDHCRERDLEFRLVGLYPGESTDGEGLGLTDRQREVLERALEEGYFEVPRRTTLTELADELGVSDQALSAIMRRGQANLLDHTLARDAST